MKRFSSVLFNVHGVDVVGYMDLFENKDHFISLNSRPEEVDKIAYLKKRIQYDRGGRIAEVGWGLNITPNSITRKLRQMTLEQRTDVVSHALKHNIIKKYFYTDFIDGHNLFRLRGDILFSHPCGFAETKIASWGNKDLAARIGKLCTRYGFSDLDEYGYQFAMYNNDLKLEPI
jgi:hypothetical protein